VTVTLIIFGGDLLRQLGTLADLRCFTSESPNIVIPSCSNGYVITLWGGSARRLDPTFQPNEQIDTCLRR